MSAAVLLTDVDTLFVGEELEVGERSPPLPEIGSPPGSRQAARYVYLARAGRNMCTKPMEYIELLVCWPAAQLLQMTLTFITLTDIESDSHLVRNRS